MFILFQITSQVFQLQQYHPEPALTGIRLREPGHSPTDVHISGIPHGFGYVSLDTLLQMFISQVFLTGIRLREP